MKTLDLRYNELWNDWNAADELQDKTNEAHGQFSLSWRNLNVSIKQITQKLFKPSQITHKQILVNINGNVKNGTLLGIMGSSGCGKTTLMATISHRMRGNFDGELLLNGRPISEEEMINISGFVPQDDVSFEELTALEHLSLMATFKMDRRTTGAEARRRIDRVIAELGMGGFLNTRLSFLSGGERKKVALAVQLINDPAILFCDEITTGLDSYSAAHIVNTLRRVARTGKIVVCTIHQPASGVFGKFDEVLLLANGRLVYHGPVTMVRELFVKFNYECPRMFNEADYVISILSSDSAKVKSDVEEICKLSLSAIRTEIDLDLISYKKELDHVQHLQTKKPLWVRQFSLVLNRSVKCFYRNYKTKLLELGMTMIVWTMIKMLIFGVIVFTFAGIQWGGMELFVIFIVGLTGVSHGTMLSTFFKDIQYAFLCATIYDYFAVSVCGGYLSLNSLPKPFYFLRFMSLYFLGCEAASVLFWEHKSHLTCSDVDNCLNSGKAVLNKYGYISSDFYFDMMILILYSILATVCGYFGLLWKIRRQPAY